LSWIPISHIISFSYAKIDTLKALNFPPYTAITCILVTFNVTIFNVLSYLNYELFRTASVCVCVCVCVCVFMVVKIKAKDLMNAM
jgi:Mn2+/Fe2+ NRAMP family transporter